MLIFDIGYNEGNFTKYVLSLYPNAKVIGVEGHSGYIEYHSRNPVQNVQLVHAVVTNEIGVVPFYICDSNPGINTVNESWIDLIRHKRFFDHTKRMVPTRSITLDYLIYLHGVPDILKLDIEGAESRALAGLNSKCGTVLLEWSEENYEDMLRCVDRLKQLGYDRFASDTHKELESNVEYLPDIQYSSWDELNLMSQIVPARKDMWGMLYAK